MSCTLRASNDQVLREELRQYITRFKSLTACAASLGISRSYLGEVLSARKAVGQPIAEVLGYRRSHRWVPDTKA